MRSVSRFFLFPFSLSLSLCCFIYVHAKKGLCRGGLAQHRRLNVRQDAIRAHMLRRRGSLHAEKREQQQQERAGQRGTRFPHRPSSGLSAAREGRRNGISAAPPLQIRAQMQGSMLALEHNKTGDKPKTHRGARVADSPQNTEEQWHVVTQCKTTSQRAGPKPES